MEPEDALPRLQVPATCPCPEHVLNYTHIYIYIYIYCEVNSEVSGNVILTL